MLDDYGWVSARFKGVKIYCRTNNNRVIKSLCLQANVGFHRNGSDPEVKTPTLDALAEAGIILDRHYVHQFCSPTRSALQTGRAPIHVNVLNSALFQHNPNDTDSGYEGIPRNMVRK